MRRAAIKEIDFEARRFRRALEKADKLALPDGLRNFPCGACGDASLILAKYLASRNLGPFEYVSGETRAAGFQTHAWLEKGELIIDITADQFDEFTEPVTITTGRSFHDRFTIKHRYPAELDRLDGYTRGSLHLAYEKIVKYLDPI